MKHKEEKGPCITVWEWPDEGGHLNRDNLAMGTPRQREDTRTPSYQPRRHPEDPGKTGERVQHTCFPFHHTRGPAGHVLKE